MLWYHLLVSVTPVTHSDQSPLDKISLSKGDLETEFNWQGRLNHRTGMNGHWHMSLSPLEVLQNCTQGSRAY